MVASYIYSRFFKFKFSIKFLIKTLIWNSSFVIIFPALYISFILGKETIKKLVEILVQFLIQSKAASALLIAVFLITYFACCLLLYSSCWIGNYLGIKHTIKDSPMIRKYASSLFSLDKPIIFAALFLVALFSIRNILFIFISILGNSVLSPILLGLLIFLLLPIFAGLFSFAYTYFYQMRMTKKFKVKAVARIAIILLIFTIFLILKNPMLKSYFAWSNNLAYEISKFVTSTSLNPFVWIILLTSYFCVSFGNKFALRFFKKNQTNVIIEA